MVPRGGEQIQAATPALRQRYNSPMPRPSRFRRFAKWAGLGVCVVILCLWAVSYWFTVYFVGDGFAGQGWQKLTCGRIVVQLPIESGGAFRIRATSDVPAIIGPRTWWYKIGLDWPSTWVVPTMGRGWLIPLWLPFCGIAIPTAILWRRDRRPRKGHCSHCGYNLTGAEHEKCPECGAGVPAKACE